MITFVKLKNMKKSKGSITPALLIITAAFVIIIYGLLFALTLQLNYSHRQVASEQALHIAEAGINYYAWHLAHAPEDYQDGTGQPGPYVHDFTDPQGDILGQYSLEITPPTDGSTIVTIKSTGWVNEYPKVQRTITAQYGVPSFAEYSFLSNASHWYGAGSIVFGRVHSNNGIRMDGINYSIVSSAKDEYMCGTETGCFPPTIKPGVWGSGGDQGLWQFPVPAIDFDSISFDFAGMRDAAQDVGLYLGPSAALGYHLVFYNSGNSGYVDVFKVTSTDWFKGYSVPGQGLGKFGRGGCEKLYHTILSEEPVGTYNLADTPIVFAEDNLWIEGTIRGRTTIAAVAFPITSSEAQIVIKNNVTYTRYDGSDMLGIIAQNDIFLDKSVPDEYRIDGIIMAQKGKVIRHGYFDWCGGTEDAVKQKLTIFGGIISYYKSYWNFGSGPESGFVVRDISYDTNALYNPPPYFPSAGEYRFISWTEE